MVRCGRMAVLTARNERWRERPEYATVLVVKRSEIFTLGVQKRGEGKLRKMSDNENSSSLVRE